MTRGRPAPVRLVRRSGERASPALENDPADQAQMADSVSLALLVVLDRLSESPATSRSRGVPFPPRRRCAAWNWTCPADEATR
jgi:hypothetical protein